MLSLRVLNFSENCKFYTNSVEIRFLLFTKKKRQKRVSIRQRDTHTHTESCRDGSIRNGLVQVKQNRLESRKYVFFFFSIGHIRLVKSSCRRDVYARLLTIIIEPAYTHIISKLHAQLRETYSPECVDNLVQRVCYNLF